MSRPSLMNELNLQDYFSALFPNSQDDSKSPAFKSSLPKSPSNQDSIEKPRRALEPIIEEKITSQPEPRNRQDYLTPIDKVTIRKSSPETNDISTRENTTQKYALSVPASNKPTPVSTYMGDVDRGLKFSPAVGKYLSDQEMSQGSNTQNQMNIEKSKSDAKSKRSGSKSTTKDPKKISEVFDEEDCDLMEEMFEADAKKKTLSEQASSQKMASDNMLTESQEELFRLEQGVWTEPIPETRKSKTNSERGPSPTKSNPFPVQNADEMPVLFRVSDMKPIKISQDQLKKASNLFKEDENGDLLAPSQKISHKKIIRINEPENINKLEKLSQPEELSQKTVKDSQKLSQDSITSQAKRIGVKTETLKKIMKLFEDEEDDLPEPPTINTANLKKKSASPVKASTFQPLPDGFGFFTGVGGNLKPVTINEERLAEATKLLEDEDNPIPNTVIKKSAEVTNSQGAVLTTGSQKSKIKINPEKFLQAKKLLDDSEDDKPKPINNMDIEDTTKSAKPTPENIVKAVNPIPAIRTKEKAKTSPFRFVTENPSPNKSTSPSTHSPKNQGTSTSNSQKTPGRVQLSTSSSSHQVLADGYSTLESKPLPQSQRGESLKIANVSTMNQVMNLFKEDAPYKEKSSKFQNEEPVIKTANGTKFNISKEALQKASNFLADDEADELNFAKASNPSKPTSVKTKIMPPIKKQEQAGFQTAGEKKSIAVNEDKFKNFKKLFEDFDDNEQTNEYDEDPELTFGFKLAPQANSNPEPSFNKPKSSPLLEAPKHIPNIFINGQKSDPKPQQLGFSKAGGGSKLQANPEKLKKFLQDFEDDNEEELANLDQELKKSQKEEPAENKQSTPPVLTHSGSFGAPKEPTSIESTLKTQVLHANTLIDSVAGTLRPDSQIDNTILPAEDKSMTPDRGVEIKPVTKKRLLNDAGKKTVPTKELQLTNNIHGKFSVRPLEEMPKNKPTHTFKFVEKDEKVSENAGSKGKMMEETKKDEKKPLKRNYDSFIETSGIIQESSIDNLKYLEENPKIKHYNSLLKISKRTDYNKSYFKLANYTKNIPKSDEVKDVTYQNSLEKTFACSCLEFEQSSVNPDSTLPCMCEGELVIGWKQLWTYMLSIGFKKDYITESWFKNHFRLIVWKLASLQRRVKTAGPAKKLTLFNVKNELEYRYYIEHIQGKRSVLQKVLQKDEVASAHMVLLIADIHKEGNKMVMQLSDGWYSVYSEIKIETSYKVEKNNMTNNQLLSYLISSRKLYSGLKIHVANMKVIKAGEGKVDPNKELSLDEKTFVELSYNSISRARWDEKLGVAKSKYFHKCLKSLRNQGGAVSMIDVIVLKKYKKIEKSGNNIKIFDELDEGPGDPNRKINFRIRVVDAAIYYGNKPERFNDTFCEIEFPQQHLYLYDEIRENERIKLYNLKGYCKYDKNNFSFYDHLTQKNLTHYLYLQIQKTSRCQIFSAIKSLKEEAVRVKEFAKVNLPSTTLLSSLSHDSDDSITEYNKLVQVKNEIDILGVILEVDHQKALGVMSNGHLFKVTFHSKPFFSNVKILEKPMAIILFRNLQAMGMEKIPRDSHYCYNHRTNESTFFTSSTAVFKDETLLLTNLIKEKGKKEEFKTRLDKLLKRYNYQSSGSLDADQLDKMLEEGQENKQEAPMSTLELANLLE